MPITIAKEKMRSRSQPKIPLVLGGWVSQIVFRAARSSPKTPEAPNKRVSTPMVVAKIPEEALCPLVSIDWTACRASEPITACTWSRR